MKKSIRNDACQVVVIPSGDLAAGAQGIFLAGRFSSDQVDVIAVLTSQGFKAAKDTNSTMILAVNGSCRMHVMVVFNNGADRNMMRGLVGADEDLIFVHQGKAYEEQPILLAVSTELWVRVLRKMGLTDRREFVLAVVAQRQCDADRLRWDQLQ